MSKINVRKAIIPCGGLGTRLYPISKIIGKELVPVLNYPMIYYTLKELINANIEEIIVVNSPEKPNLTKSINYLIDTHIITSKVQAKNINNLQKPIVREILQKSPLGLGDAILIAKSAIENEPFLVILPDDIIISESNITTKMIKFFNDFDSSIIGIEKVPKDKIENYGIINGNPISSSLINITDIIEKPPANKAPTNLAVVGRYLFTPEIFDNLIKTKPKKNNEIQITDAIKTLLSEKPVLGYQFTGKRYDCGTPLGIFEATIGINLNSPKINSQMKKIISNYINL